MAEDWAKLKELRLRISDPFGFIDFQTVADKTALPATPKAQTVYRSEADSEYFEYKNGVWVHIDIEVSDETLNGYIASDGVTKAVAKAVRLILASIGKKLYIAQSNSGVESTVYVNLTTLKNYYESLIDLSEKDAVKETGKTTGVFLRGCHSEVGGIREW